ncbi:MAG: dehydrogenase E1 component subunit alpha/beta [Saprospiraceae bacterium]|jgi:2-oxoisovalerate dehydrogenase E1 component|nr:dehydrogenase E1 component subunit alpha/beta [Saprospiraceae bacterium]
MPTTTASPIKFKKGKLSTDTLLKLYRRLLKPRMIEEKMLILLRQGQVSKWFSGIGQEAIAVGVTSALLPDELVFTLHRNLGVFTVRDVPLATLFSQWQGKKSGFSKGRERSFHFGTLDYGIVGMISHLGPQLALADGAALAHKLKGEGKVALAFSGEGGTSEGDFHEALNVAAVWDLPVIFIVENNGYGLSTTTKEQYRCENIADKGVGYGMKSVIVDGNNILEVYNTIDKLAVEMRKNPHPVLVECKTFRMRGHEEASGVKYVPKELLEEWAVKDPLDNYEKFLLEEGVLDHETVKKFRKEIKDEIDAAWKITVSEPEIEPNTEEELGDIYAPMPITDVPNPQSAIRNPQSERRYIDAISDGLRIAMQKHSNLVLMGQDIADYGGVFKITQGFMEEFGKERVRNTPICESAIIGAALGLSLKGFKSMVEMQFADFVTCAFNQIVNNLAKIHYRWGVPADVVVRMPSGGGVGAGPFHSQTNEAWFVHTPGLKVVIPSTPYDAKGLLLAAFEDPNPVMYFEHKALYRAISEEIPDGYYTVEIGKARVAREGSAVSVITYGMGVHWALKVCEEEGIDADIIDLRTLLPLDYEAITATVKKTNRVVILHEDTLTGGVGSELSAWISEHLFEHLDGPLLRAAGLDTPVPFAIPLEQNYMPVERFRQQLRKLASY